MKQILSGWCPFCRIRRYSGAETRRPRGSRSSPSYARANDRNNCDERLPELRRHVIQYGCRETSFSAHESDGHPTRCRFRPRSNRTLHKTWIRSRACFVHSSRCVHLPQFVRDRKHTLRRSWHGFVRVSSVALLVLGPHCLLPDCLLTVRCAMLDFGGNTMSRNEAALSGGLVSVGASCSGS